MVILTIKMQKYFVNTKYFCNFKYSKHKKRGATAIKNRRLFYE
jgi:hypothetical protein